MAQNYRHRREEILRLLLSSECSLASEIVLAWMLLPGSPNIVDTAVEVCFLLKHLNDPNDTLIERLTEEKNQMTKIAREQLPTEQEMQTWRQTLDKPERRKCPPTPLSNQCISKEAIVELNSKLKPLPEKLEQAVEMLMEGRELEKASGPTC